MKKYYPYNKEITIELGTPVTNNAGSDKLVYEPYLETWANVFTPYREVTFADGVQNVHNTEFTIRNNSKTKLINSKYRIISDGLKYTILRVIEVDNICIKIIAEANE